LNIFEGYVFQNINVITLNELLLIIQWILWVFENQNLSIERIFGNSGMILEILARLNEYRQFLEDVIERYDDFLDNGAAQGQAPKAMPPITPASDACPFNPCNEECVVCMEPLSGECEMPPCRHALHSKCMSDLFENGSNTCPSCREKIDWLVRKTHKESPNAPEE
jgi:hypothetical protein